MYDFLSKLGYTLVIDNPRLVLRSMKMVVRKVLSTFALLTGVDIFYTRLLFFMFFSVKLTFVVDINPRTMFFIPQEKKKSRNN